MKRIRALANDQYIEISDRDYENLDNFLEKIGHKVTDFRYGISYHIKEGIKIFNFQIYTENFCYTNENINIIDTDEVTIHLDNGVDFHLSELSQTSKGKK